MVTVPDAAPEMVRKAFKQAETERPGATFLILPEDVAERDCEGEPLPVNVPVDPAPAEAQVTRAVEVLAHAKNPVVLAGPGVARDGATDALIRFSERLSLPVATTFLGKGVFPDDHSNALGTIGFMVKDYAKLRVRPRRRGRRGGVRPRGVLAEPLEPARRQADRARPPHRRRGRLLLHARRRPPRRYLRLARRDRHGRRGTAGRRAASPRDGSGAGGARAGAPPTARSR
jgi:hypothetical protein